MFATVEYGDKVSNSQAPTIDREGKETVLKQARCTAAKIHPAQWEDGRQMGGDGGEVDAPAGA